MIDIKKKLTQKMKAELIKELKEKTFPEGISKDDDKTVEVAAQMLIKIYVYAYNKGYEKAKNEVLNGE